MQDLGDVNIMTWLHIVTEPRQMHVFLWRHVMRFRNWQRWKLHCHSWAHRQQRDPIFPRFFFVFLNFNSLRKKQRITEGCSRGTQRGQGRSLWMFRDSNGYTTTENEVSRGRFVGLGHSCISVAQRPSNGPAPRAQKRQKIYSRNRTKSWNMSTWRN